MTVFNCQQVLDKVVFYLDNEIDQSEREPIDQHLKECKSCVEEYAVEARISSMILSSAWNPVSTQELVNRAMQNFRKSSEQL